MTSMSYLGPQTTDHNSQHLPSARPSSGKPTDSGVRREPAMAGDAGAGVDMDVTNGNGMRGLTAERYVAGTMVLADYHVVAPNSKAQPRSLPKIVPSTIDDVVSRQEEREGPRRKKAKVEARSEDDEAKKARGRPRLDAKVESAADVCASFFSLDYFSFSSSSSN